MTAATPPDSAAGPPGPATGGPDPATAPYAADTAGPATGPATGGPDLAATAGPRTAGPTAAGPRPYDAVLCDVDNVIRSYDTTALAAAETAAGAPVGATARAAFSPEVDGPLLLGRVTPDEWADGIVAAFVRAHPDVPHDTAALLARTLIDAPLHADAEVVALLRAVREHVTLVLVSNASVQLEADLEVLGLTDLAHHVVSSARVGVAKPDPRIYAIAADRARAVPERCLFVDDREDNVLAARALGMSAVHFHTSADLHEGLRGMLPGAD